VQLSSRLTEKQYKFDFSPIKLYDTIFGSLELVPIIFDPRFEDGDIIVSLNQNMAEKDPSCYLNCSLHEIERYSVNVIKSNIPLWFGCDVKKQLLPERNILCDLEIKFLPEYMSGVTQVERINYYNAFATHAMVITGVDIDTDGVPTCWKAINSWGQVGRGDGVYAICHKWFLSNVYSILVPYTLLSAKHRRDWKSAGREVYLAPNDRSVMT